MSLNPSFVVRFEPMGRELHLPAGTTVMRAARQAGVHINASCGGAGTCGKCRVRVLHGEVDRGVSERLSAEDIAQGIRQACSAEITADVTLQILDAGDLQRGQLGIDVPVRHRAALYVFDVAELHEAGIFTPPVEKFFLEMPRPDLNDHQADAGRVIRSMKEQYNEHRIQVNFPVLQGLRRTVREDDFRVTVTLERPVNPHSRSRMIQVQAGNWARRNFGLAIDIGTTTVYGQLIDILSGEVLAENGVYNKQISYCEDVISRMIHAEQPDGLEHMHDLVLESINGVVNAILDQARVARDEISSVTLAGNTAMTHLFLQLEPHNIRRAPYVPVSTFYPPIRATDLGLVLADHAIALCYPAVSSYVGGDIVAGVMGSGMYRTEKMTLYVDIGTNAEIVIGNREWLACAACSAGPAFEGGGIQHGMRAADGAIEDFSIDPLTLEPMALTVNNKPARGICGSGLLIMIAELFEAGIVDHRGRFDRSLDSTRLRQGRSGFEYVIVRRDDSDMDQDIVLTEVDIDNFIRAKGAIHAGVRTLLAEVGLDVGDLEQIILAGGFGSYVDLDSAMIVGLLPEMDPGQVVYVGNGSLMGCRMSALSNHIRRDVVNTIRRMTSFELSEVSAYHEHYVASLFLPHTDLDIFPLASRRRLQGETG